LGPDLLSYAADVERIDIADRSKRLTLGLMITVPHERIG
jgi:hypothetical protein